MARKTNYPKEHEGATGEGWAAHQEFWRCADVHSGHWQGEVRTAFCRDMLLGDGWYAITPGLTRSGKATIYVHGPYPTRKAALAAAQ